MAASNTQNVPLLLKELWVDGVENFQYEDRPFYAMVGKDTSWSGIKYHVTVQYANGTSVSRRFGTAKDNKRVSKFAAMEVETADLFAIWSVDNKMITLTRDQKGSLLRMLDKATEDAQDKFRRRTAWQLWGNGGGAAGRVATNAISGAIITLANPNNVRNFDIGDPVEFSNDDGRGGAGILGETRTIIDIDEDLGQLEFDSSVAGISGLTAGDYIFHLGDYGNANEVMKGVTAYVALQTPGTGAEPQFLWGMDRGIFPTRLAGHRMTPDNNLLVIEAVKQALTKAFRRSSKVTKLFCSPEIFNEVEMSLEGQRRYADETIGKVGFTGLEFTKQGSSKTISLFADPDIGLGPNGEELIFGLGMDTWVFHTAEEWPMWLTRDGEKKFMTEENANAREGRLGGYGNLYTTAPGHNFVLLLG